MGKKLKAVFLTLLLCLAMFGVLDFSLDIIEIVSGDILYVNSTGSGGAYTSIQDAIDNASNGDTVFVYNGTYYENVVISKTLNLIGEDRDNTTIHTTGSNIGIFVEYVDYVNISGFTVENGSSCGIRFIQSNNSIIENNRFENNGDGLEIMESNNTLIRNNIVNNNSGSGDIGIHILWSTNLIIQNNTCIGNIKGIYIHPESNNNTIIGNYCSGNWDGIYLSSGFNYNNYIANNYLLSNRKYGMADFSGVGNIFINNTIQNNEIGFKIRAFSENNQVFNSTIMNSSDYDITVAGSYNNLTVINTTFNKTKVRFDGQSTNLLINKWYLHVNVIDSFGNPVPNANVKIEDSKYSSNQEFFITDNNGYLRWLTITEYNETDPDGDEIGEKTYHTPHKIVAWNNTSVGYAQPIMNESKTVTIVLNNGTFLDLEPGWNLISLPRTQSDTNLKTVLQSIEDQYDAVQWYNATNSNDPWKHHQISKPSYLNDLESINHTMGFWVHVTDPGGTTLVVFGDVLTSTQNITLYPGWNLVGYPSTIDKTRTLALNNLFFDTDVDAIWTHNATTQKWKEITASDNFEVGRGYWIHAKAKVTWIVPI